MTTNISVLIDIQNGFANPGLSAEEGGSLYVPEGEKSAKVARKVLNATYDSIIVLTQDFHPANHISFMTNHPGIMAMRQRQLASMGKGIEDIMKPWILPFTNILIDKNGKVSGILSGPADSDPEIYLPELGEDNRILGISSVMGAPGDVIGGYLSTHLEKGSIIQTLWSPHCIQGTKSAAFDPALGLKVMENEVNHGASTYETEDEKGNQIFIIRKGMNQGVDSYGLGRENDRKSETGARDVFKTIAKRLAEKGETEVNLNLGGLATNFCVEFSNSDLHDIAVKIFAEHCIKANVRLVTDMSFGIPLEEKGGQWPDLNTAANRMAERGTTAITSKQLIEEILNQNQPDTVAGGRLTAQAKRRA